MTVRTTPAEVRKIISTSVDADLTPFIETASSLIDRVKICAASRGYTLSANELRILEMWMAAHYYSVMDPQYKQRMTEKASATFEVTRYDETAKSLDPSGCIATLLERKRVGAAWLGKRPSNQTDYEYRD